MDIMWSRRKENRQDRVKSSFITRVAGALNRFTISSAQVHACTLATGSCNEHHISIWGTDLQVGDALIVLSINSNGTEHLLLKATESCYAQSGSAYAWNAICQGDRIHPVANSGVLSRYSLCSRSPVPVHAESRTSSLERIEKGYCVSQ